MSPADVIAAARQLIGTPYRHQGRHPGIAVDCIGLLACVARALAIPYDEFSAYGPEPCKGILVRELDKRMLRALWGAPGCAVILRWYREPQHCGVLTDAGTLIHAHGGGPGFVCEHRIDEKWSNRFIHAYAFPAVEYPAGVLGSAQ